MFCIYLMFIIFVLEPSKKIIIMKAPKVLMPRCILHTKYIKSEIAFRAAFRIFIQGGRNGFPRNVGGADGYSCAFGTRQLGGSGGMPPQEIFAILSIQRSLLVSFRGGLFYLFCI